jgi:tetratricopeptide (TPR) repeat protein
MSPEQVLADSRELDARSDIYSLGAVMYEMLTGQPPHDAANVLDILRKVTDEEPVPPRQLNPAIPEEVEAICLRALAKDPEDRFASAGQVASAIQAYLLQKLRRSPEGSDSAPEAEWLSALMLPMARPARRRRRLGRTLLAVAGGVVVGALLALVLNRWFGRGPEDLGRAAEEQRTAQVVAQAREQLKESLNLRGNTSPRDQLQAILEDLTAVLKRSPDHAEARWLRARAYRWAGEHLAAQNDLTELLRQHPDDRAAIVERLLTNYELFVLYLGNLNDPLLRPMRYRRVQEDVQTLKASGNAALERVASLVEALARHEYETAAQLAQKEMPPGDAPVGSADVAMLEADALFHAALEAHAATHLATEEDREAIQKRRASFVGQATQALRRGLRNDPNHIGLLFLKANAVQSSAAWETPENEDRAAVLHRLRPTFDAAFDRFRRASLGLGCETAIARAVLLMNYDPQHMTQVALNEIRDALSYRPTASSIYSLRAWLQLLDPAGSGLTAEEAKAVLRDMELGFETPTDDYHPYFIRAVVQAAAGQWEQARIDLEQCRQKLGKDTLPTSEPAYNRWFSQREASTTRFLFATLESLMDAPIHLAVEQRMHLAEEVLKRLAEPKIVERDELVSDEIERLRAWTHFRLAKLYTEQRDSNRALPHVEQALRADLADLTVQTCRTDPVLHVWDGDPDFFTLYQKFSKR